MAFEGEVAPTWDDMLVLRGGSIFVALTGNPCPRHICHKPIQQPANRMRSQLLTE